MSISIRMVVSIVIGVAVALIISFLLTNQVGGLEKFIAGNLL